ncbi:MAG: glyoxalase/bleomycin resistance protein/dioxygenase [Nevskia sp.]|nr:glyoxalase/bleomycin resistance protein/dioxygenase [Nevskia sp.]
MQITPYLHFNGQCEAAFKFYEQCLGGKILMMMNHGESPMAGEVPVDWHAKIMHARMSVGEVLLMGSDAPPDRYETPRGFSVSLGTDTAAEAERIFNRLAAGGTVQMPIQPTFWAERFGMVVDRFDIPWMVNCEKKP